jgi:hypothetical protein
MVESAGAMSERPLESQAAAFPRTWGRYVLLKEIGRGGMGQVYLALQGGRVCAVKALPSSSADPSVAARLHQEARLLTQLSHPNLVFVFEAGKVGVDRYLAMEYIRGKTLFDLRVRLGRIKRPMPVGLALLVVRELLRGLSYVHDLQDLQVVHRDVAPTNVLLSYEGSVKLIDFGIAKSALQVEQTIATRDWGQKGYKSPEQIAGRKLDARSDIFSAGVILWELLTGRSLFPEDRPRTEETPIPAPSQVTLELSRQLDGIVLTALARDPNDRYRTASEFADVLTTNLTADFDAERLKSFMTELFAAEASREAAEERTLLAGVPTSMLPADSSEGHAAPPITAGSTAPMTGRAPARTPRGLMGGLAAFLLLALASLAWLRSRHSDAVARRIDPEASRAMADAPAFPSAPVEPVSSTAPVAPAQSAQPQSPARAHADVKQPRTASRRAARPEPAKVPPGVPVPSVGPSSVASSAEDLMERAETAYQARRLLEAMHAARAAVKVTPSLNARLLLGKIYLHMERYREALQEYDAALDLSPSDPAATKGRELAARHVR